MRAVFLFPLIGAQQGGVRMSSHPLSHDIQVTPVQVWPALSHDLRTRIVSLLAQLALNVVVAHPINSCSGKEVACVQPTAIPQNPS
jgi:hypothetical protein